MGSGEKTAKFIPRRRGFPLRRSFGGRVGGRAKAPSREQAMMLLELMMATAILGVALITLGVTVGRCVRGLSAAEKMQMVLDVAQCRLAEWKTATAADTEIKIGVDEGEKVTRNQRFEWHQEIETTDDPDLLTSRLIIRWKESGRDREKIFVELVRKNPKNKK